MLYASGTVTCVHLTSVVTSVTLDRNSPPVSDVVVFVLSTKLCLHFIVTFPFVSLVLCVCLLCCIAVPRVSILCTLDLKE